MNNKNVTISFKKKRIINTVLILLSAALLLTWMIDSMKSTNENMTLDQRIINILNESEMHEDFYVKEIALLEEFSDGYICVAVNKSNKLIFSYFVNDVLSDNGLAMKARLVSEPYNYINNSNPLKVYSFTMSNFDRRSIYFGCYKSDKVNNIGADGESIKQYKADVRISETVNELYFWFIISDKSPVLSELYTQ